MAITEKQRHQLFTTLEEKLGPEEAATVMELLPPVGWAEVATKHDVARLDRHLTTRLDTLERRMDGFESGMRTYFLALLTAMITSQVALGALLYNVLK